MVHTIHYFLNKRPQVLTSMIALVNILTDKVLKLTSNERRLFKAKNTDHQSLMLYMYDTEKKCHCTFCKAYKAYHIVSYDKR